MLAKELVLAMLENGESVPKMNQTFFSGLSTAIRNGRWKFQFGHSDLLSRHQWKHEESSLNKTFLCQAMSLSAKKMAAELNTHYERHYDQFYARWKKLEIESDMAVKETDNLETKIRNAWQMRRDLENAQRKGFALFPESNMDVKYITFDASCIASLYRTLDPETWKGKTIANLIHEERDRIFNNLFYMDRVNQLRSGRDYHFRYALYRRMDMEHA